MVVLAFKLEVIVGDGVSVSVYYNSCLQYVTLSFGKYSGK